MSYSMAEVEQIVTAANDLEKAIEVLADEVAKARGVNQRNWNYFQGYEIERASAEVPDKSDYYENSDGNWYHYNTGNKYEDDLAAYKETTSLAHATAYATFDTSYCGDCCSEAVVFPLSYLWCEDWREQELALKEKEREQKRLKQEQATLEGEIKKRAIYERLKQEFEGK